MKYMRKRMERVVRTKNGNVVIYKGDDVFIVDGDKNERLSNEQLQEIADNMNEGVENGNEED